MALPLRALAQLRATCGVFMFHNLGSFTLKLGPRTAALGSWPGSRGVWACSVRHWLLPTRSSPAPSLSLEKLGPPELLCSYQCPA